MVETLPLGRLAEGTEVTDDLVNPKPRFGVLGRKVLEELICWLTDRNELLIRSHARAKVITSQLAGEHPHSIAQPVVRFTKSQCIFLRSTPITNRLFKHCVHALIKHSRKNMSRNFCSARVEYQKMGLPAT